MVFSCGLGAQNHFFTRPTQALGNQCPTTGPLLAKRPTSASLRHPRLECLKADTGPGASDPSFVTSVKPPRGQALQRPSSTACPRIARTESMRGPGAAYRPCAPYRVPEGIGCLAYEADCPQPGHPVASFGHSFDYSLSEYIELEAATINKHEYLGGQIFAMAGGSPEHSALIASVGAPLFHQMPGGRLRVHSSNLRLRCLRSACPHIPTSR